MLRGLSFPSSCPSDVQDHIWPILQAEDGQDSILNLISVAVRSAAYMGHIWFMESWWARQLSGSTFILLHSPEKTVSFQVELG
jgi:hypothetical protein